MDRKERQKIEQQRREMALTNTFFNRSSSTLFNSTLLFWKCLLAFESVY